MTASDPASAAVILNRARARARAEDLCRFIDASPMPFQGAEECARTLRDAGFEELSESDSWDLQPGGGYFLDRNGSTVIAFRMGGGAPAETGVSAVGAHLDSPNLRVKPHAATTNLGYRQLAVDVYGGPILASWSDRDLGLAGRVVLGKGTAGRAGHLDRVEDAARGRAPTGGAAHQRGHPPESQGQRGRPPARQATPPAADPRPRFHRAG